MRYINIFKMGDNAASDSAFAASAATDSANASTADEYIDAAPPMLSYTPLTTGLMSLGATENANATTNELLGDDMAAIRARVMERHKADAAAASATNDADANKEVYEEIKKQHQVDLNDEEHAATLEDKTLLAHMEAGRRRLAEHEKALLRLPKLEELRSAYLQMMGKLSSIIRELDDMVKCQRENVEYSHYLGGALLQILDGKQVHGFPELNTSSRRAPDVQAVLAVAQRKSKQTAESYEAAMSEVEKRKTELFTLRRQVEQVGDGLIDLVEACEEDRRRLREYLMMASQTKAGRDSAAPPDTLGEQIVSSPALPEKSGLRAGHDE